MKMQRFRHSSDPPKPAAKHKSMKGFAKYALLYGAIAGITSVGIHSALSKKAMREVDEITHLRDTNHLHARHESDRYVSAVLRREAGEYDDYRKLLLEGGYALGDLQWITLLGIFHDRHIPFTAPFVDRKDRYMLGKGITALAGTDDALKSDVERWKSVRDDALKQPGSIVSEVRLVQRMVLETVITEKTEEVAKDLTYMKPKAFIGGLSATTVLVALASMIAAIGITLSRLKERLRSMLRRRKEEAPEEKPAEKPAEEKPKERKDQTPTKLEPLTSAYRPAIGSNGAKVMIDYLPDARKRLADDFGPEFAAAVSAVLNGKFSNTVARQVAHGNYDDLRKLMLSSRKAFEVAGHDAEDLERMMSPRPSLVPQPDTGPQVAYSRARHPLDDIKRWGWRPNDFHQLLSSYGFDTSDVGGGGHCFVKYGGEKLRRRDGRFVLVPHKTSGTEIRPGTADKILKSCADFLVSKGSVEASKNV